MPKVKLCEVARESREVYKGVQTDIPVVGLEHIEPEEIKLSSWDVNADNTFTKAFHKGQMLFGRRRAYLKKAAQAPFDGICSGDITVIEAITDRLIPELLPFIIQNDCFFDYAVGHSAGSLSPRVKWEHLQSYEFDLPDIPTQRRLADLLWAMEDTKTAYKNLIAATDDLVKSQFVEMFGTSNYPTISLSELCSVITKGTTPTTAGYSFVDSGINFLKVENITEDNKVDMSKVMHVDEDCHKAFKRSQLLAGDIVFSIAGARSSQYNGVK